MEEGIIEQMARKAEERQIAAIVSAFNSGVEAACQRIETCNDETPLMCRIAAARALKK